MRFLSFLNQGPFWSRGIKYALLVYLATFSLLLIPLFGWLAIQILGTWFLFLLEGIFGNLFLTTQVGGSFLSFSLPTMLGWGVLLVLYCCIGLVFGMIIDLIRKPNVIQALIVVISFGIVLSSFQFYNFVTSADSLEACDYLVDGYQAKNKSDCQLEYLDENPNLASLDFCEAYFNQPAGGKDFHSKCLSKVAQITKNDKICDLIPDHPGPQFDSVFFDENIQLRDACYQATMGNFSEIPNDISLCDKRLSEFTLDRCFRNIAALTNNAEICENIISSEVRGKCYLWVGMSTGDTSLCSFLDAEYKKRYTDYKELCAE